MSLGEWYLLPVCTVACLFIASSNSQETSQLIRGQVFKMNCFNSPYGPSVSYVELIFTPDDGIESTVAKYDGTGDGIISDTSYTGRLSFNTQGQAVIQDIRVEDEGTYTCIERSILPDKSKSARLEVMVLPVITTTLLNSPLQARTSLMEAAACTASDARPQAIVSWSSDRYLAFNETKTSTAGSTPSLFHDTAILSVVPTKFFDKQPFICKVKHPAFKSGENATMVILAVQYAPSTPVIEVINQNTQLRCKAEGNPLPTIKWKMPRGNTDPNPTQGESVIRIISPENPAMQNDTYICTAENGIGLSTSRNITTAQAVTYVEVIAQSNTGLVVGIVVGCIVLLAIVGALVYWFCIRKLREKDTGPYPQKRIVRQTQDDGWARSSGRPIIQHANEDLNRSPPPEPKQPPPDDEDDQSNSSHSEGGEYTEGDDVELHSPANGVDDEDAPTAGIISKNSVNFQHRRKRPSTSPRSRSQKQNQPEAPPVSPQADPHYEVPPTEYYDDEYDEEGRLLHGHEQEEVDDRFYDRPEDRYPGYQPQQRYDDPPMDDQLPPYSDRLQYASIDHSYNPSKPRSRPPYQEPVEYAEIRSHGQIV